MQAVNFFEFDVTFPSLVIVSLFAFDPEFAADHSQEFSYRYYIQAVPLPAPGIAPLLAVAGCIGRSCRRT